MLGKRFSYGHHCYLLREFIIDTGQVKSSFLLRSARHTHPTGELCFITYGGIPIPTSVFCLTMMSDVSAGLSFASSIPRIVKIVDHLLTPCISIGRFWIRWMQDDARMCHDRPLKLNNTML